MGIPGATMHLGKTQTSPTKNEKLLKVSRQKTHVRSALTFCGEWLVWVNNGNKKFVIKLLPHLDEK